jgi:hypothetical protein
MACLFGMIVTPFLRGSLFKDLSLIKHFFIKRFLGLRAATGGMAGFTERTTAGG